jgi:hypothetical protein
MTKTWPAAVVFVIDASVTKQTKLLIAIWGRSMPCLQNLSKEQYRAQQKYMPMEKALLAKMIKMEHRSLRSGEVTNKRVSLARNIMIYYNISLLQIEFQTCSY